MTDNPSGIIMSFGVLFVTPNVQVHFMTESPGVNKLWGKTYQGDSQEITQTVLR